MNGNSLLQFTNKIQAIIEQLDELETLSLNIGLEFRGSTFEGQDGLAVTMENLAIAMTHESASQIALMRQNLLMLKQLFQFRRKYHQFSDAELVQILDHEISIKLKLTLADRLSGTEIMLQILNYLQADWNKLFSGLSYKLLKKRLLI